MNTISCVIRGLAERSLGLVTDKTTKKKKKPRVKHEPRSAHGRVVKKKHRVKQEPRSAHGRAVN